MYDVIIIGAGPAGISAALYAKRANLSVAVVYSGESQLEKAHKIENYYGFPEGITGADLYANGIAQAKNLGVEVIEAEVTGVSMDAPAPKSVYTVALSMKSGTGGVPARTGGAPESASSTVPGVELSSRSLIIATGNKKLRPALEGIVELEGKGVSYCAVCDGFFYRKKQVAVIGSGTFAASEAEHLSHLADKVTILTNGAGASEDLGCIPSELKTLAAENDKIAVDSRPLKAVLGSDQGRVSGLLFEDGTTLAADGVFVALGSAGAADFAKKLGLALDGDSIKVDEKMATNAPGVFCAGNATGGLLQVCKAVYEGGVAGLSAVNFVRESKKQ